MSSDGPEGRGTPCNVTSSFRTNDVLVVGAQRALFGACSKGDQPSIQGKGLQREKELTDQLGGPQQPQGPLASSEGYPQRPTPAPGVPLTPDMLENSLACQPPQLPQGLQREKKRH